MSLRKVDDRVIEACQQGDREAFRELFEAYKDRVYSIALHYLNGDEAAARDLTQDVFLKLITKVKQFRYNAEFATWLYRLVANACMDEQRKRRRLFPLEDSLEASQTIEKESQEERHFHRQVAASVKRAVSELRPKLRIAVLLKYFDDLSYEEMAKVLGCSVGTVASRLNRGHQILARKLGHLRGTLGSGD